MEYALGKSGNISRYDLVVIGAGQGGVPLALAAAQAGRHTALIESTHVGGTCINEGCTPTKTMIASAGVAETARRAPEYGANAADVRVDLRRVERRKDEIVGSWRASSEKRIDEADNLELIPGRARFREPHLLEIVVDGGSSLLVEAGLIVLDTGSRPSVPALAGLDSVPFLNSTSIMELPEVPEHLLILGGGYVAVEFAQMFRRFGSQVTVVQRSAHLLSREDEDVAEALESILREDGITIRTGTTTCGVSTGADADCVVLTVRDHGVQEQIAGTHLLVATGRVPNTDDLDLAKAGVEADDRGYIRVDDRLATSAKGVYAIGDVKGGAAFTHISYDDFRILRKNLLEGGDATTTDRLVPYTVFTDPQLGRVGMSEREARQKLASVRVAKLRMDQVSRALESGRSRGLMKAVVDAETDRIVGAAVLAMEGGEVMAMLEIAMMGGVTASELRDAVFAHPTLAEALNTLFA